MRGKGVFEEHSQATSWAGKRRRTLTRTLTPCKGKGKLDSVDVIDVDSDECDEIIIDTPVRGKFPFPYVISLDDDDDDEEEEEEDDDDPVVHPENHSEDRDFLDSDESSTPAYANTNQGRNRYGLGPESASCSCESDSSDCEVLDGSLEELREQWEKVVGKKKSNIFNGCSRNNDQNIASSSSTKLPNGLVERKINQPIDSKNFPFGEGNDDVPIVHEDIIGDREKLKETDEYKRVMEEEWASRQKQLQIQAEEAQRLRKRRKAEIKRLDMEKRQKQRVEEVRETQKKDEEYINQKEQLRAEVRYKLTRLEMVCIDLASLLRSLGIPVRGSSSAEVHAAYKQALLKFHPDRASRMDIREQVESEEKFKLISLMKEKFSSTK
ncbi:hypothetical protein ACFE04_028027 [Oxalis oulophora]